MDILGSIFLWMCYASLGASLVAILLVAIKKGVSQAISWRMHHLLWFIVLARLMIPVLPESSFSLFTWVFWASNSMSAAQPLSFSAEPQLMPNTQLPVVISEVSHELKDNEKNQIQTEAAKDEGMNAVSSHPIYIQVLTVVWLVGVVFLLARLFAYLYKIHNKERFLMRVTDERVFSIMDDCRKKFGVKRKIHVYTGTLAKGPLISNLFSPWVYCPRDVYQSLSDAELYHVFSHELAHHKRKDLLWSFLGSLALAIHWMNPLVWLWIRKMKADMELACDEYVLEVLGEKEAISYGMTLLSFARRISERRPLSYPLYFHHSHHSDQMKRRIQMISKFKKGSYPLSALAVACGLAISVVTLTNAAEPTPLQVAVNQDEKLRPLFGNTSSKVTNRLEKAERLAGFSFKVPSYLPSEVSYKNSNILHSSESEPSENTVIHLFQSENISLMIGVSTVENTMESFKVISDDGTSKSSVDSTLSQEQISLKGKSVKVNTRTATTKEGSVFKDVVYLWSDEGLYYYIKGEAPLENKEIAKIIESFQAPNAELRKTYVNYDFLNSDIYDLEDLEYFSGMIGFAPVFPLELPGGYKATGAYVNKKLNFSYPENEEDKHKRTIHLTFENPEKPKTIVLFAQIKDKSIVENIRKTKKVPFERIDGAKFEVPVTSLNISGQEVFRTAPYKVDDTLSSPKDKDNHTYFWLKEDVCLKVTFKEVEADVQQQLVAALVKEKAIDLKK
ncbi:M56 family metallopeptidase [Brevibacillus sp. HB1.2]|uniref:M56 family metallopeptidase n=1 Tax=Brevibacillus sp. HB1.2 TaxID=2738807 RepID=UPI0015776816|nr:M56 family metallopeptidase [Brevibacillus sp. HB1.2]NTU18734.1 M56 family metallopeptidase [Brevibacillus sp. HB1.2]